MRKSVLSFTMMSTMILAAAVAQAKTIPLDGKTLTIEEAMAVARGDDDVKITPEARSVLDETFTLVMEAARKGMAVYGLTTGVGLNKDKQLFDANGSLSKDVLDASRAFNRSMLLAHSAGVGPMMSEEETRLYMVIRLNTLLRGNTGAQPRIAEILEEMLNKNVIPVVPSRGSLGEADITLGAHIGAVMMGEWKVWQDGRQVDAAPVLKEKKITPLIPQGKDGLAIISSNAGGAAMAVKAYSSARRTLDMTPYVFSMSLQGLNGNVAPFLPQALSAHPFPGLLRAGETILSKLEGSSLWDADPNRALQDPLSFRTMAYTLAEAENAMTDLKNVLEIQINSSDDNPSVMINPDQKYAETSQAGQYFFEVKGVKGAIIPTANFNPLPVAAAVQRASVAFTHLSHNAVQRTLRLSDTRFTKLPRFLQAPENNGHGFGAIAKPYVAMHAENMSLASPVSFLSAPVAGEIEDTSTNLIYASERFGRIAENLNTISSFELLHAAQALDLRALEKKPVKLSDTLQAFRVRYRELVPFVHADRIFTGDIEKGAAFLKNYK